jgi:thiopeptide-type bacteriocin biosynthesis protein
MQRVFIIGDRWLYYKIYLGTTMADLVLTESIKPSVISLIKANVIDQWFYIRYADPEFHIRIRIHMTNIKFLNKVILIMHDNLQRFIQHSIVWRVQIDTYQREVERYGNTTMELSEQLFFHESMLILNILPYFKNADGEKIRWHFALKYIDLFLESFQFLIADKLHFMEYLKDSYRNEFELNRQLKDKLNSKFSKEWKGIEKTLDSKSEQDSCISHILINLNQYQDSVTTIFGKIKQICCENKNVNSRINELAISYIHMFMNRLFKSKQRIFELVLYDFLWRYYKSTIARQNLIENRNQNL